MKTLFLLRHGKSDRDAELGSDHERPLAPRGKRSARRAGQFLTRLGIEPQLVISSSAVRARRTAEEAAKAGKWAAPIDLARDLYLCPPRVVLEIAAAVDDSVERLLLAGHEPTLSGAIELLCGARVDFVTGALVRIDVPIVRWRDIETQQGRLLFLIPPRLFVGLGRTADGA